MGKSLPSQKFLRYISRRSQTSSPTLESFSKSCYFVLLIWPRSLLSEGAKYKFQSPNSAGRLQARGQEFAQQRQLTCRSEGEHLRASIREWKDISAEGVALPQPTARSKLLYILYWIKYTLVPEPVRYVWWIVWSAIRQAWYPYHKKAVLEGKLADPGLLLSCTEESTLTSRNLLL